MPKHWRSQLAAERRPRVTEALAADLRALLGADAVRVDEPLSGHTTWRIGGPADLLLVVPDVEKLQALLPKLHETGLPVEILGAGSNVLVQDGGLRGVAIQLGQGFTGLEVQPDGDFDVATIGAAVSLGYFIKEAKLRGWTGVAPIAGTPGTVGGGLRMNAGDRLVWLGHHVVSVDVVTRDGRLKTLPVSELGYAYRTSRIPAGSVIVAGRFRLRRGDVETERAAIDAHLRRRRETQPLNMPSCGSVFRNPEGASAGALIEQVGLKGVRLRQAQISDKHANFIVNLGGATARDVLALVRLAKETVQRETGHRLEEEMRVIGEPVDEGVEA